MNSKKDPTATPPAIWDVVVVGGGPAGMMAAGRAAEHGARVLLLEKNDTLGKKLLLTGGGRCNLTNAEFDTRKFLEKLKDDGKFLFSTFSQWDVSKTLEFFHTHGMETKIEDAQRVFPMSNRAQSVWDVLIEYMRAGGVTIMSNSPVRDLLVSRTPSPTITGVLLRTNKEVLARTIIIATGGSSHPETGSTGEGFTWLKKIGHVITEPTPSLVPVVIKDPWIKKLAGIALADAQISVFQNMVKQKTDRGKILFTHFGISGPVVLHMSKKIGELLKTGEVIVSIDVLPSLNQEQLDITLQNTFTEHSNKKIGNSLSTLIPAALVPIILAQCAIQPETVCNSITREERLRLISHLKNIPVHADKLLGMDKAIITSGGVSLTEIDPKTMRSRIFPNLYLVGDILNIDRPSGGYSLQLCWTTGFVAGDAAGKNSL
ncbi:MAG: NAD(P)/FAD-dependent oxidoreductase [Candidatus Azambacteria bacterium]|nr:NAD(P)/FAD-dependent oxidoreductase [Candidatus Azambacteria bacterium]